MQTCDVALIGELPGAQADWGKSGPSRMVLPHVDEETGNKLPRSGEKVNKGAQDNPRGVKIKMPTVGELPSSKVDGGKSGPRKMNESKLVPNLNALTNGRVT